MMTLKQNIPVLRAGMLPFQHAFAALVQDHLLRGPAKGIRACVNWILQDARNQPRRRRDKAEGSPVMEASPGPSNFAMMSYCPTVQ